MILLVWNNDHSFLVPKTGFSHVNYVFAWEPCCLCFDNQIGLVRIPRNGKYYWKSDQVFGIPFLTISCCHINIVFEIWKFRSALYLWNSSSDVFLIKFLSKQPGRKFTLESKVFGMESPLIFQMDYAGLIFEKNGLTKHFESKRADLGAHFPFVPEPVLSFVAAMAYYLKTDWCHCAKKSWIVPWARQALDLVCLTEAMNLSKICTQRYLTSKSPK